jgi:hypothetical protein
MVPQEMVRIDIDLFDDAAQSQLNDTPVVAGSAAPARFPSIHPFAAVGVLVGDEDSAAGFQQIFLLREELVVGDNSFTANALGSQVDEAGRWGHN